MIRIKKHYLLDNAIALIQDLISQLESKVSLSEDRCAELSMEVDELSAHVKVNVCLGPHYKDFVRFLQASKTSFKFG